MDDYFLPPGVSPWPKGGIQRFEFDPMLPVTTAQRLALRTSGQVIWGERLKSVLRDAFHHMRELTFETFQDFVPNEHTYVELDPTVRDRLALPVARIHLDDSVHHALSGRFLFERGREILERLGADRVTANGVGVLNPAMTQGIRRRS